VLDADHARAADVYAAVGSEPDEAVTRLHVAARASEAGDVVAARGQLERALGFFRRAGAGALLREAERLASSLQPAR
jgi:hypothetical protein